MTKPKFAKRRGLAMARLKRGFRSDTISVPAVAPHERDAASFWYRRIATSLLIGNGAGVVAVAGFVGKAESLPFAASIAYPTLTLYLTGVVFGFFSLFVSLFWASLRIEVYSEFHAKLAALGKKAPSSKVDPPGWFVNSAMVILMFLQVGVLLASGAFFWAGSAQVAVALGRIACGGRSSEWYCEARPSFLFPELYDTPLLSSPLQESSWEPVPTFVDHQHADGSVFSTVDRLNFRAVHTKFETTSSSYLFRLSETGKVTKHAACFIGVADWFRTDQPPYSRHPQTNRFLAVARGMNGNYRMEPMSLRLAIGSTRRERSTFDIIEWDVTEKAMIPMESDVVARGNLTGVPGPYRGGLLVYSVFDQEANVQCLEMAQRAGFDVLRER